VIELKNIYHRLTMLTIRTQTDAAVAGKAG
jgi:hypothetical protein